MTLATVSSMVISLEDFNPPLNRIEAAVPGYWTVEELANELGTSTRKVLYDITVKGKSGIGHKFQKHRKLGPYYLIPDDEAIPYLFQQLKQKF